MIACPYCGRQNETPAAYCSECGTELPAPASKSAPDLPPLPPPKLINPQALAAAFSFEDGFHRVDWEFVRNWIESEVTASDWETAWNEAALLWVTKLRDDIGGNYAAYQSRQTLLLCEQPIETTTWLLDYAGRAATTIRNQLGQTAWHGAFGKDVALVFSEQDDYYQYVAYHLPDGESPRTGGMCLYSGYTHIALPWTDQFDVANAIIHELAHDCLAHLPLPLWLNEGVAVTLERAIGTRRSPMMWDELAERHFAFWNKENIQTFWAGTSFHVAGDSNELSYSLAEVFVNLLSERASNQAFRAFLENARSDDAGQTAALDIPGADLGDIAGTFLGDGDWGPQRAAIKSCWKTAGWNQV